MLWALLAVVGQPSQSNAPTRTDWCHSRRSPGTRPGSGTRPLRDLAEFRPARQASRWCRHSEHRTAILDLPGRAGSSPPPLLGEHRSPNAVGCERSPGSRRRRTATSPPHSGQQMSVHSSRRSHPLRVHRAGLRTGLTAHHASRSRSGRATATGRSSGSAEIHRTRRGAAQVSQPEGVPVGLDRHAPTHVRQA